jgi:hypothetical protein
MPCICELSRLGSAGITLSYCVYQVLPTPSRSATGCYRSCAGVYIQLLQGGVVDQATMAIQAMYLSIDILLFADVGPG